MPAPFLQQAVRHIAESGPITSERPEKRTA
jgi:hypothetical protein